MSIAKRLAEVAFSLALAGGFAYGVMTLLETPPPVTGERPAAEPPAVQVTGLAARDHEVRLTALGTVRASVEAVIRTEVAGRVVSVHPDFQPGGLIPAGDPIVTLDQSSYRLALIEAEAELAQARAALDIEQGQQKIAREEMELLSGSVEFDEASLALTLRQPQLRQAQATIRAAEVAVSRARSDIAKTTLTLPYDAIVLEPTTTTADLLVANAEAGRVARADEYWVEVRLPAGDLARLVPRGPGGRIGSVAEITLADGSRYMGDVLRILPDLAEGTRLGAALVSVGDPIRRDGDAGRAPLLIGALVDVSIEAGVIPDAVRVPRDAIAQDGTVLVVDATDRVAVRTPQPRWQEEDTVLVSDVFQPGDRLVTSQRRGLLPGTAVTVVGEDPPPADLGPETAERALTE